MSASTPYTGTYHFAGLRPWCSESPPVTAWGRLTVQPALCLAHRSFRSCCSQTTWRPPAVLKPSDNHTDNTCCSRDWPKQYTVPSSLPLTPHKTRAHVAKLSLRSEIVILLSLASGLLQNLPHKLLIQCSRVRFNVTSLSTSYYGTLTSAKHRALPVNLLIGCYLCWHNILQEWSWENLTPHIIRQSLDWCKT